MEFDQTVMYEDFVQARMAALEATDRYREMPDGDPRRDAVWIDVVNQTRVAHLLLKRWLAHPDPARIASPERPLAKA